MDARELGLVSCENPAVINVSFAAARVKMLRTILLFRFFTRRLLVYGLTRFIALNK